MIEVIGYGLVFAWTWLCVKDEEKLSTAILKAVAGAVLIGIMAAKWSGA